LKTEMDREYTTFNIIPGLADEAFLSIQAATDMNYCLRSQDRMIRLHENSGWMLYKENATFKPDYGLADTTDKCLVSFRMWKYPELWIRHKDGKLYIEESDGSELFKKNATFILRPPNWDGKNRLSKKRTGENSFSSSRIASFAAFLFYIALIVIALSIVVINLRKENKIPGLRQNAAGT
jgi:hypothetical protein